MSGFGFTQRFEFALARPSSHATISNVAEESLADLIRDLRDNNPEEYALLQEHLFVERHLDPRETGK